MDKKEFYKRFKLIMEETDSKLRPGYTVEDLSDEVFDYLEERWKQLEE